MELDTEKAKLLRARCEQDLLRKALRKSECERRAFESVIQNEPINRATCDSLQAMPCETTTTRPRKGVADQILATRIREGVIRREIAEAKAREAKMIRVIAEAWAHEVGVRRRITEARAREAKARAREERKKQKVAEEKACKEALKQAIAKARAATLAWDELVEQFLELILWHG